MALVAHAGAARAQSFVQRIDDEDACRAASTFETNDQSAEAMRARRACRLQRFEQRLAVERQARVAAGEQKREAAVQAWMAAQEPTRVVRPIAITAFVGSGLASYGLAASWTALRSVAVDVWVGGHDIGPGDYISAVGSAAAPFTRTCFGAGGRWFLTDHDVSPYLGAEFATTSANLDVNYNDNTSNGMSSTLSGSARAHAVAGRVGLDFAYEGLRASLEYVYAYPFYTQANKDDASKTPDDQIRRVWQDSLDQSRSGVRVQVGYAF